jgi:hypothetical protein
MATATPLAGADRPAQGHEEGLPGGRQAHDEAQGARALQWECTLAVSRSVAMTPRARPCVRACSCVCVCVSVCVCVCARAWWRQMKDVFAMETPAIANYTTGEVMGHSSDRLVCVCVRVRVCIDAWVCQPARPRLHACIKPTRATHGHHHAQPPIPTTHVRTSSLPCPHRSRRASGCPGASRTSTRPCRTR